jgi:glutathione S-transferase
MIKIWGRINSINVQKAVWAAIEAGAPFERVDAGMAFGVVGTPEFRAKNPNARIPVLEDGELVLWESNAIVRYIAAAYAPGTLWPEDPKARARADMWMDWASLNLLAAMTPPFWQLIRTPEDKRDPAAIEEGRQKTEALLAILDEHLGRHPFVGGESFTMGDIAVGVCAHRWQLLPIAREGRPNVERWLAGLRRRSRAGEALLDRVT